MGRSPVGAAEFQARDRFRVLRLCTQIIDVSDGPLPSLRAPPTVFPNGQCCNFMCVVRHLEISGLVKREDPHTRSQTVADCPHARPRHGGMQTVIHFK